MCQTLCWGFRDMYNTVLALRESHTKTNSARRWENEGAFKMSLKAALVRMVSYLWHKKKGYLGTRHWMLSAHWVYKRAGVKSRWPNGKARTWKMVSALLTTLTYNVSSMRLSLQRVLRTNCKFGTRFTTINLIGSKNTAQSKNPNKPTWRVQTNESKRQTGLVLM